MLSRSDLQKVYEKPPRITKMLPPEAESIHDFANLVDVIDPLLHMAVSYALLFEYVKDSNTGSLQYTKSYYLQRYQRHLEIARSFAYSTFPGKRIRRKWDTFNARMLQAKQDVKEGRHNDVFGPWPTGEDAQCGAFFDEGIRARCIVAAKPVLEVPAVKQMFTTGCWVPFKDPTYLCVAQVISDPLLAMKLSVGHLAASLTKSGKDFYAVYITDLHTGHTYGNTQVYTDPAKAVACTFSKVPEVRWQHRAGFIYPDHIDAAIED